MLKRILVSLLAYLVAFYPIFGSLANAGSSKSQVRSQESAKGLSPSEKVNVQETYGKLPLSFIQNNGQVDEKVKYYEKGTGHATFFAKDGVYLSLHKAAEADKKVITVSRSPEQSEGDQRERGNLKYKIASPSVRNDNPQSEIVKLIPVNANKNPEIIAQDKQEGKVNYFIGNDPNKWKTNIPTYGAVVYKEIYKGIDMKFYGNNRQLEYDIIVKPGADPNTVKLSYEGIEGLRVAEQGDLEITLKEGKLIQKKPYIYQDINGKRVEVDGRFKVQNSKFKDLMSSNPQFEYGFQVASYNKNHPLIIDPVLVHSTYLGGGGWDEGYEIAIDTSGNVYATGFTESTDFPTVSPIQGTYAGGVNDIFVTKINVAGSGLIYSTYLGGGGYDEGLGIAVDASGNAYITGRTLSYNFPTVSPIDGTWGGSWDAFVAKIDAFGGAIIYSTYLGGSNFDFGYGIAVDSSGNVYVTGSTWSTDFPTASPIYGVCGSCPTSNDAFITKINASGSNFIYSTYLGGSITDDSYGITVDASGNAYITGSTTSPDFPLVSPISTAPNGSEAFVTKIDTIGSKIIYSTYIGEGGDDYGYDIAVDTSGSAYITGWTKGYVSDAFVKKIDASGTSVVYSKFIGGSSYDFGFGIAVDNSGNAYITGYTDSADFPTISPMDGTLEGFDAFITKIDASGTNLVYSTYLGGSGTEKGHDIAIDVFGNVYIIGITESTDFPTVSSLQGTNRGYADVFVAKIVSNISGCIQLNGSPVADASVVLKQKRETDQTVTTDANGCYKFEKTVSGKLFQVIINGPMIP